MNSKKDMVSTTYFDPRSTHSTFIEWCDECTDDFYEFYGVLSISGSDGIRMDEKKIGGARYEYPDKVDEVLEEHGYYEDGYACGEPFKAPTKKYGEWFKENYPAEDYGAEA